MDIISLMTDELIRQGNKDANILYSMFGYYNAELFNNDLPVIWLTAISGGDMGKDYFITEMDRTEKHPHLFINNALFGQYKETDLLKVSDALLSVLEQEAGQAAGNKKEAFYKWFTSEGATLIRQEGGAQ